MFLQNVFPCLEHTWFRLIKYVLAYLYGSWKNTFMLFSLFHSSLPQIFCLDKREIESESNHWLKLFFMQITPEKLFYFTHILHMLDSILPRSAEPAPSNKFTTSQMKTKQVQQSKAIRWVPATHSFNSKPKINSTSSFIIEPYFQLAPQHFFQLCWETGSMDFWIKSLGC